MSGFPANICRTNYIRKLLKQGVIARLSGEDFNVAAVRSRRGAIDSEFTDVDKASVFQVDEEVVEAESEPMMGPLHPR